MPLDAIADTGNSNTGTLTYTNAQGQTLNNRITTANYRYDPAGNLAKGQAPDGSWQRYQYDASGRLTKVINDANGQELASYSYGAGNQRLIASDNNGAVVTYYAWSGGQVIAEYEKSGTSLVFQKSYLYFGGTLLMTEKADQSQQYHHPDRLGTRMVTNGSGGVIAEHVVLPYGTMLEAGSTLYGENSYQSTTPTSNPSKRFFTSYDRSETTKLEYAVNRHYNAGHGRFTQVDPQEMGAADLGDPQTLNLYAYCGNDPINRLDPDGLGFLDFLKGLGQFLLGFFGINTYGNFSTPPTFPTGGTGVPGLGGSVFGGGGFGGGGYGSFRTPPFQFASVGAGGVGYFIDLGLGNLAIGAISNFLQRKKTRQQKQQKPKMEKVNCPGAGAAAVSASGRGSNTTLTYADGTQEVRHGGSRAWRNNNPGNIRPGYLQGEIGRAGGFTVFSREAAGQAGIVEQLGRAPYPGLTVFGAVSRWAPPSNGNDTATYQARVQNSTGINGQTQISTLSQGQLQSVANAIRTEEGWIPGTVTCWRQKTQ